MVQISNQHGHFLPLLVSKTEETRDVFLGSGRGNMLALLAELQQLFKASLILSQHTVLKFLDNQLKWGFKSAAGSAKGQLIAAKESLNAANLGAFAGAMSIAGGLAMGANMMRLQPDAGKAVIAGKPAGTGLSAGLKKDNASTVVLQRQMKPGEPRPIELKELKNGVEVKPANANVTDKSSKNVDPLKANSNESSANVRVEQREKALTEEQITQRKKDCRFAVQQVNSAIQAGASGGSSLTESVGRLHQGLGQEGAAKLDQISKEFETSNQVQGTALRAPLDHEADSASNHRAVGDHVGGIIEATKASSHI